MFCFVKPQHVSTCCCVNWKMIYISHRLNCFKTNLVSLFKVILMQVSQGGFLKCFNFHLWSSLLFKRFKKICVAWTLIPDMFNLVTVMDHILPLCYIIIFLVYSSLITCSSNQLYGFFFCLLIKNQLLFFRYHYKPWSTALHASSGVPTCYPVPSWTGVGLSWSCLGVWWQQRLWPCHSWCCHCSSHCQVSCTEVGTCSFIIYSFSNQEFWSSISLLLVTTAGSSCCSLLLAWCSCLTHWGIHGPGLLPWSH